MINFLLWCFCLWFFLLIEGGFEISNMSRCWVQIRLTLVIRKICDHSKRIGNCFLRKMNAKKKKREKPC